MTITSEQGHRPPSKMKANERPLVEDIRLLGRLLGDVIREQEGQAAFDQIEQIRKLSVAFRRDADTQADKALKKLLKALSGDRSVSVIRAFTYFSHLANLAEDRHHIRRREVHERAGTLLSNMDMVMAKSDLALASRYSELVTDARLRKKIFTAIEAEWHRTANALTLITGDKQRLTNNAALQRSIRHRFPYIDPLHHLQVELVRRYRAGQADERVQRGIHISINGIAAGLRNTG